MAYATVLMVLAQGVNVPPFGLDDSLFGLLAVVVAVIGFPAAVAVAVLRYRLYDIDRLISRTLVYGMRTATLVAAYLGSVLLFRLLLEPLASASDLAVASFSGRLRHEVDLEAIGVDLRSVVHDTVRPAHVTLWLRDLRHPR